MEKDDTDHILTELHDGLAGGHFVREITAHEILREGYDWPTLFIDAHAHAQKCQIYQVNVGRERQKKRKREQISKWEICTNPEDFFSQFPI